MQTKVKECEVNRKTRCKKRKELHKAMSVQVHEKKNYMKSFYNAEISNKLSKAK